MVSEKISYQGKNVIVTGAASGLGRCLSIHFSKKGANLILIDKNGPLLKQVCFEINNLKGNVDSHVIDLSELEVLPDNIDTILMGYDRIDVLVNCAGIEVDGFVDDTPIEGFRENYDVNLYAPLLLSQKVIPLMKKAGRGQIVNVSSDMAKRSIPGRSAYCMTKSALSALTETLRLELAPYNIDAVLVFPSVLDTPFRKNIKYYGRITKQTFNDVRKRNNPSIVASYIIRDLEKRKLIIKKLSFVKCFLLLSYIFLFIAGFIIRKTMKPEEMNL